MNQRSSTSETATEASVLLAVSTDSPIAVCSVQGLAIGHGRRADPTQDTHQSRSGRRGLSSGTTARQSAVHLWGEDEISALMRLVELNTSAGRIAWVDIEREWKSLGLSRRTKAALTAKYRSVVRANTVSSPVHGAAPVVSGLDGAPTQTQESTRVPALDADSSSQITSVEASNGEAGDVDSDAESEVAVAAAFKKRLKFILSSKGKNFATLPARVGGAMTSRILSIIDDCIGRELDAINVPLTWEHLTSLVRAGALTATELRTKHTQKKVQKTRNWVKSIKDKIGSLRATMGKATAELARRKTGKNPTYKQTKNIRMLKRDHHASTSDEILVLISQLGDRLQLLKARLELREKDDSRRNLRRNFTVKALDRCLEARDGSKTVVTPNLGDIRKFWKGIVGRSKPFDPSNAELSAWAKHSEDQVKDSHIADSTLGSDFLTWEIFETVLKKAKPWKAPGPDGLHTFWWKVFKQAGRALYHLATSCIEKGIGLPSWLTCGRVVLIHKSGSQTDPANYRPIACLNTSYKLITAMLASYLGSLVERLGVLPGEQVAIRKGTWGCTHAMLIDQAIVADATNQKQKPLHVAWIDYTKAFDSLPHAYIKWLLERIGTPKLVLKFINSLVDKWTVRYESRDPRGKTQKSAPLAVRSGVLQGDSFSPLLFCIAMAPLSHAINSLGLGYASSAGGKLDHAKFHQSHLFYMDDLKVYSTSAGNLDKVLCTVERMSRAISMLVNAKKCARVAHVPSRLGSVDANVEPTEMEGEIPDIKALQVGETYKYLGIEQRLGIKPVEAWKRAKDKFMGNLEGIWSLDLTFGQKVRSSNSLISMMSYVTRNSFKGGGTYRSTLKRGDELDTLVRKLLVRLDARYKSNAVARLYLPTKLGGCGLTSVRDSLAESTIYAWAYISTRSDLAKHLALFQALANRNKRCVISDARTVLEEAGCIAKVDSSRSKVLFGDEEYTTPKELARAVVASVREMRITERYGAWKGLVAAGRVLQSRCSKEWSFSWLEAGKLNSTAVRNVLAAQEGCLWTRASPSNREADSTCRKCKRGWETAEHVLTSCSYWLPNLYISRHDSIVRCVHYWFCRKAGLVPPHHTQRVPSLMENERFKLCSNMPIQTKPIIRHNKPDIVLYDNRTKVAMIVEIAVSWHSRLEQQRELKQSRYMVNGNYEDDLHFPYPRGDNIVRELSTTGWEVKFAVIIVGACGEMCESILEELDKIGISGVDVRNYIERMSRSAVLGSNRIIKQHLVN